MTDFNTGLERRTVNHAPLTPLDFIARAADVYGDRLAVVHGEIRCNWRETYARSRQLASALQRRGIAKDDTVAVLLPNIPAMVECHFGVPMAGAVLNTLNTRLDFASILYMLRHGEAKVLIADTEYLPLVEELRQALPELQIIGVHDQVADTPAVPVGWIEYEILLRTGDTEFDWQPPADEWDAIALNYTSGTTGDPKGVVYHHRGAALNAISNILEWDMPKHAVYLWTLPMFHCNGWCFPWTLAARAGVNICLRKFDPQQVLELIAKEKVTHYCGAPIVQSALANAPAEWRKAIQHKVSTMVAASPPSSAMLAQMVEMGFDITHVYGLTEVYGPATVCAKQEDWAALSLAEQAQKNASQGVRYHLQKSVTVMDPETMQPVPADGETLGEIMFRGNICMKGYLKNPAATEASFKGDWFHTGDLAVMNPDGYVRIKDRSKDIIISGGENISSIEIEDALYQHPAVIAAAVVAAPDAKWGEVPCAFIETRVGVTLTKEDVIAHCRKLLASFKVPKIIVFKELPKTSTGKIQKFLLREEAGSITAIDQN
ncbi:MAG: acyl-CoA synthetase [Oxalobacteraceae bacterium]|nr:acyl-CoA synthetase [Oxalobacteraceae bacterium]